MVTRNDVMKPRAVLFDLDCTLTDRPVTVRRFAEIFVGEYPVNVDAGIDAVDAVAGLIASVDGCGYAPRPLVCGAMAEGLRFVRDRPSAAEVLDFWRRHFAAMTVLRAGAARTLDDLRAEGLRLAVVSNGAGDNQRRKLAAAGLGNAFDAVVISGEVGCRKPDGAIFGIALERLGIDAADAWFVGDHPQFDIEGARRARLAAVWVSGVHPWPENLLPSDRVIATMPELPPLVRGG
jgi:putative hydrolase of the HAD superfamily